MLKILACLTVVVLYCRLFVLIAVVCDTGSANDVWSGAEESMFRVLYRVFPANHCAISQMLVTKLCRQVRSSSSSVGRLSPSSARRVVLPPGSVLRSGGHHGLKTPTSRRLKPLPCHHKLCT